MRLWVEAKNVASYRKAARLIKAVVKEDANQGANGLRRVIAAGSIDRMTYRCGHSKLEIFISGFWRSGTTWLQQFVAESLSAKTIFEPLSPMIKEVDELLMAEGIERADVREELIRGPMSQNNKVWVCVDKVIDGRISGYYPLLCRESLSESLRSRIVLKDVRLQLNLLALHNRYGVPILHVRRHPFAVVASMSSTEWGWSFRTVRLLDIAHALSEDVLSRCGLTMEGLAAYDTQEVTRIAALWAITERIVSEDLRDQSWGAVVIYKDAVSSPQSVIDLLSERFNLQSQRRPRTHIDSPVTHAEVRGTSVKDRDEAWRRKLTPSQIDNVREVVEAIYPEGATYFGLRYTR